MRGPGRQPHGRGHIGQSGPAHQPAYGDRLQRLPGFRVRLAAGHPGGFMRTPGKSGEGIFCRKEADRRWRDRDRLREAGRGYLPLSH